MKSLIVILLSLPLLLFGSAKPVDTGTPIAKPVTQTQQIDTKLPDEQPTLARILPETDTTGSIVPNCGDNTYANFIYTKESTCNTGARNANGCYGIGQDCSGALEAQCGSNYDCQNAYFNDYAIRRYGSWAGAYAYWITHRWW